jgi:hypothetical protein
MTEQPVGPRCGNNPNVQLTPGDRQAVDDFKARLALRARIADTLAATDGWRWVSDSDKARSSTYRGYQTRADAVLAVLPTPADRAAILREAADLAAVRAEGERSLSSSDYDAEAHAAQALDHLANHLRRMADEAQQPETQAEDRLAILREEAVKLIGDCPDHSLNGGALQSCQCEAAGVLLGATRAVVRQADTAGEQQ